MNIYLISFTTREIGRDVGRIKSLFVEIGGRVSVHPSRRGIVIHAKAHAIGCAMATTHALVGVVTTPWKAAMILDANA